VWGGGGGGVTFKPDMQKKGHFGLNHTLLPLDLMILFGFYAKSSIIK
jgi:hypothetical protein